MKQIQSCLDFSQSKQVTEVLLDDSMKTWQKSCKVHHSYTEGKKLHHFQGKIY